MLKRFRWFRPQSQTQRRPRSRRAVLGFVVLALASLGGVLGLAYSYLTDSANLSRWIAAQSPKYFPGSRLQVHHVQLRATEGVIHLRHLSLTQKIDGADHVTFHVPWMEIRCDPKALLRGELRPFSITMVQPVLRLRQREDGSWNLQRLLADPWPGPKLAVLPTVQIQNGVVELTNASSQAVALLRAANFKVAPGPESSGGLVRFEGDARGDLFDSVRTEGTFDRDSQRMVLKGDVARLELTETLRGRLPAEHRRLYDRAGLQSGELDLTLERLAFDPAGPTLASRWSYDGVVNVRSAAIRKVNELPFALSDLSARVALKDGLATIHRAAARNGKTIAQGWGKARLDLDDLASSPFDLNLDLVELELDDRIKSWLPETQKNWWDLWLGPWNSNSLASPAPAPASAGPGSKGRVDVAARLLRDRKGAAVTMDASVDCHDVSMLYREFPYPLPHVNGLLVWQGDRLTVDLKSFIGGKEAWIQGTVDHPGRYALAKMKMGAKSFPVDQALLNALKPQVRGVVEQFEPTGTGLVDVDLTRTPPTADFPQGKVDLRINVDLQERCAIRWQGLPYPITSLTGKLKILPDRWIFEKMRGYNARAVLEGDGQVWRDSPTLPLQMDLRLKATNLAFDQQLRIALPPAWRKTWATLNPSGASDVDAQIEVRPGKRHDYFVIKPRPDTRVQLLLPPLPSAAGAPGQPIRLPAMEDVRGTFVFNDGIVSMHGVGFEFRGAPVRVETGQVRVQDTGAFDLVAQDLMMTDFRLDAGLRKLMSPLMAQYARRLNDETISLVKGNLRINWSGQSKELAQVGWNQGLVVFNGNSIQAGMPLEHLQGQIDGLKGWFNGRDIEMSGAVNLDSLSFQGLQFVKVRSPLHIGKGQAGLSDITAELLGGQLKGRIDGTMDATPKYSLQFALADADLEQLAMTMPGRQRLKGRLSGQIVGKGMGQDRRTLQGQGWARIQQGDLGELPAFLSLIKFLKLSAPVNKTAFDSAQTAFRIKNGAILMDTLKFEGDAFSLEGVGKVDAMDNLDMRLQLLLGRDGQFRLPVVSDLLREAGGQILVVRVQGTTQSPRFGLDPLPQAADIVKSLMNRD